MTWTIFALSASVLFFPIALAQNSSSYGTGLIQALNNAGLTTLASVAQTIPSLPSILQSNGNHTVFAPSNSAFSSINVSSLSQSQITDVLLYHVLQSSVNSSSVANSTNAYRTLLNDTSLVNLPGNASQVLILDGLSNGTFQVVEAVDNVVVIGNATYENLIVHVIDQVLTIPGNLTSTASAAGLSSLLSAVSGVSSSLPDTLDNLNGITVFAPSNQAFSAISGVVSSLNTSQIANVLENHILNGSVVYSSEISDGQDVTSASGEILHFIKNSTGVFIQSANVTAQVTRADIPIKNGVVHLIDQVLANTASNSTAAAIAVSSASSMAQGATSTVSGPVSAPSSSSTGSKSASWRVEPVPSFALGMGLVILIGTVGGTW